VRVTVNYEACKSAIELYLSVIKRECVTEVPVNPIIRTTNFVEPVILSRVLSNTWQYLDRYRITSE
jgi:hypothetical protein